MSYDPVPIPADFATRRGIGHLRSLGGTVYFIEGRSAVGSSPCWAALDSCAVVQPPMTKRIDDATKHTPDNATPMMGVLNQ